MANPAVAMLRDDHYTLTFPYLKDGHNIYEKEIVEKCFRERN